MRVWLTTLLQQLVIFFSDPIQANAYLLHLENGLITVNISISRNNQQVKDIWL